MPDWFQCSRPDKQAAPWCADQITMQGSMDIFTLIFLGLAIFVAWRLRSVLGQKTGHEKPPGDIFGRKGPQAAQPPADSNVIRMPGVSASEPIDKPFRWNGVTTPGTPIAEGLDAIVLQEPGFDAREFLQGAKSAYEMIVLSFARGDRKALKGLLAKDVYDDFDQDITDREARKETVETTFVSLQNADIQSAEVKGRAGFVTVRFQPKLISAVRDSTGKVIDGSAEQVVDVTEIWTFSRQLGSRDPNWLLVATESGN